MIKIVKKYLRRLKHTILASIVIAKQTAHDGNLTRLRKFFISIIKQKDPALELRSDLCTL